MKVLNVLYLTAAVFLTSCASMDNSSCAVSQTGEGQSFSKKSKLLQVAKSIERPANISSKTLKPIKRPIASIPPSFLNGDYSGRCDFIFDIAKTGKVINLDVYACSSFALKRNAVKAIEQWTYETPMKNGQPVIATGVQARMYTKIQDSRGKICPLQEYES